MDNDGPPFVDFKCLNEKCGGTLCRTDGYSIRLFIGAYVGTIWIKQIELECAECGKTRWWFSKQENPKYERKPRLKRTH